MKRSEIQRKTPLRAASPKKRKPRSMQKVHKAKDCRWRSKKYLAFVRSLPCCFCAHPADDAHHIIGMFGLSGMGLTAPDSYAMSLCRPHHAAVHASPDLQQQQPDWLRWTIRRGLEAFSDAETRQELTNALALIEAKSEVMS